MDLPFAPEPDDVLAQPTRARLFSFMNDLRRPVGTAELAEHFHLHPNGVRVHLERMEEAGLISRTRTRQARGRPRDAWTIAAGARPGGEAPSAYADLGHWLARAIPSAHGGLRDVEDAGRAIGREIAPGDTSAGLAATMAAALGALGFQPEEHSHGTDGVTYCLGNCPYRDAVHQNRDVVCTLHRGMTRGMLEALDPAAVLASFDPHDPDRAGCMIEITGITRPD